MLLSTAIENFDSERANSVFLDRKIQWISQLDFKIFSEFLSSRGEKEFDGYDVCTPMDTVLKAPEEYSEIYSLYMAMKLDYMNGEIGRMNNSAILFNRLYKEMGDFINRRVPVNKNVEIKAGDLIV